MAPRGEQPPTYGGILSAPAATVVAVLVGLGVVAGLGWKARDLIGAAEAAQPSAVVKRLDKLDTDMLLIKCRLGIENICPTPNQPVNVSGIGR